MALNEMMHRPVVKKELVEFMRTRLKPFSGELGELEKDANTRGVPIIPHETAVFLNMILGQIKPKQILEIGAAIGFSGSLMAQHVGPEGHVTTIDRFDVMIRQAKDNFEKLGVADKVTLLEGDAAEVLPTLSGPYDFIFMDSAKSKYYEFLPHCMRLLKTGGMLVIDDVFQAGTILDDVKEVPKRVRKIHIRLNQLMDTVLDHPALETALVPLGDGLLMIVKKEDFDFSYILEEIEKEKQTRA
ncbi:o-methyltransferase [Trichococcus palustris]|uniref:tRNA 5-hydroxyuridine methyltransferase n=1 Tax=Trichococcus palustris TaxID=140314 RepID=A0A143YG72_9LACT|nr:O-methyltransferase [Trichococcus palustris]CZQ88817.1 o-methyltransferase [Trichococcus palustris]SFL00664.1 Predicted O-methyltransferase YrrM [Trichococcus palustris]